MNSNRIILLIGGFFLYLIIQVLLLKNIVVFGLAFCFLYVLYILLLPLEMKTIPIMLVAFVLGMGVDLFYDTLGMHTASLLALAFLRNSWLKLLTPTGGYDENLQPSMLNMGFGWFTYYSLPLILLHHFIFFLYQSIRNQFIPCWRSKSYSKYYFCVCNEYHCTINVLQEKEGYINE